MLALASCGGSDQQTLSPQIPAPSLPSTTVISGKASYERVPHDAYNNGLAYSASFSLPIRGARVELVADGQTIEATSTSDTGDFAFEIESDRQVSIRVKAESIKSGMPAWDFRVVDNVRGDALYALTSEIFTARGARMTVDLEAASGWTGSDYTQPRAAAPFAVLDTIYGAVQNVLRVRGMTEFPALELNWSPQNRPTLGVVSDGEIGGSFFRAAGSSEIYLLGAANADTDEYDEHIIVHEFTHYLHHHFGRSDSLGGNHSIDDRLDPRVAFSEGLASAFAAIILGDAQYVDALGFRQAAGASINIEDNQLRNPGWYNEGSVQALLYDLYDARDDEGDSLALGFAPLFEALTGPLRSQTAFVTVHAYLDALKRAQPAFADSIDQMAAVQRIHTQNSDAYGLGEWNNARRERGVLPMYLTLPFDGSSIEVCTLAGDSAFGVGNKLGNRRFLRFTVRDEQAFRTTRIRAEGPADADPDMVLHRIGIVQSALTAGVGEEVLRRIFTPGDYVLEVYDYRNITDDPYGDVCFSLSVEVE
ncbi:MAG: hypothetical protein AAF465_06450 [Pseudomonadota bacterium]